MSLNATYDHPETEAAPVEVPPSSHNGHPKHLGTSVAQVFESARNLVDRQLDIWLTKLKMKVIHIGITAALLAVACGLVVVGLIFALIGLFKVLTDVAHIAPVWASLIFAGACMVLAALCCIPIFFSGNKKKKRKEKK